MTTLRLKLSDEAVMFAEVVPSVDGRLREVADGMLQANFDKVSRSLRAIMESIDKQLKALPQRPDKMTIEMGAELRGEADLWLVAGETKGHLKVTMTWERSKAPAGADASNATPTS